MKVIVPDLDFYADTCNFLTMKLAGALGVIIRAGQRYWKDPRARIFMEGARDVKLPIGSYWYFDSRESPKNQARYWSEVLQGFETPLHCWADFEENYLGAYSDWTYWYDFLEYSKELMPDRKFGIYAGYYYWRERGPNPLFFPRETAYFGSYPLWLPWYTNNKDEIKIPLAWLKEVFWQFTDDGDGVKYGIGSEIDLNEFNGNEIEYADYFNLENIEDGGQMVLYNGVVTWSTDINIRREPFVNDITNPAIGVLHKGESFVAKTIKTITPGIEEWMELQGGGWFASIYNGNTRVSYQVVPSDDGVVPIEITIRLSDGSTWKTTTFEKVA
jgi:GH25 family lysozyme M1 (1,4-beta-N-acetylmuramidase)